MSHRVMLVVPLVALALAACVNQVGNTARPCEVAADCEAEAACVRGACVPLDDDLPPIVVPDGGIPCSVEREAFECGAGSYCAATGVCTPLPSCEGGAPCPDGLACDFESGRCARPVTGDREPDCAVDADCDDGVFCNGAETCDPDRGECRPGTAPCGGATPICDEAGAACVACQLDDDCPGASEACLDNACVCQPSCAGRECGDDGCGGSCGTCQGGSLCGDDGLCGCVPECGGRACGSDGCGGSCGECGAGEACDASGQCVCEPDCDGRQCGDDGCGGTCGTCPEALQSCDASGQCVYVGDVCDAFLDPISVSAFGSVTGSLTSLQDEVYPWDNRPERYLDNFALDQVASGQNVTITLDGTFDTYLYVYNVAGGQCSLVAKNDDRPGGGLNSGLSFTTGAGSYQVVATSWAERATGNYTVTTEADLCGLEVADAATYAKCFPKRGTCSNSPCIDPGNSPEFCCITEHCRTGYATGNEIRVLESAQVCMPEQ